MLDHPTEVGAGQHEPVWRRQHTGKAAGKGKLSFRPGGPGKEREAPGLKHESGDVCAHHDTSILGVERDREFMN